MHGGLSCSMQHDEGGLWLTCLWRQGNKATMEELTDMVSLR